MIIIIMITVIVRDRGGRASRSTLPGRPPGGSMIQIMIILIVIIMIRTLLVISTI